MPTAAPSVEHLIAETKVTSLTFARKERHTTLWIEGKYPIFSEGGSGKPESLFADLIADGWRLDESIPALTASVYDEARPLGERFINLEHKTQSFTLSKGGTGLFGGWTEEEKRAFTRSARTILRRHGFTRVPTWTKTWRDLI